MSKSVKFNESAKAVLVEKDGTYEVTLLTPGQGTTAYYTEELIERDAPAAFPKGTHVYLDHLQEGEVRTTQKLVGTLVEDTTIRESDGAAINRLKPFRHWADFVEDIREAVALSINSAGKAVEGMIEGKKVVLAESLTPSVMNTVDIVPWGGRQGSGFNESLQSALNHADEDDQAGDPDAGDENEGTKMELDEASVTALSLAISKEVGATLAEALAPKPTEKDENADRLETVEAVQAVESAEVPASVKTRLLEGIKDGSLGVDAVKAEVAQVVALREEIVAETEAKFNESVIVGAAGAASKTEAPKVSGWGK